MTDCEIIYRQRSEAIRDYPVDNSGNPNFMLSILEGHNINYRGYAIVNTKGETIAEYPTYSEAKLALAEIEAN